MPPLLKWWTTWVFSAMSAMNSMTISIPIPPVDPLFLLFCLKNHLLENSRSLIYGGKMMALSTTYFALGLAQALGLLSLSSMTSMVLQSQLCMTSSIFYVRRMVGMTTVLQRNSRISSLLFVVGLLMTLCNIMSKLGDLVFDSWSKQNGTSLSSTSPSTLSGTYQIMRLTTMFVLQSRVASPKILHTIHLSNLFFIRFLQSILRIVA